MTSIECVICLDQIIISLAVKTCEVGLHHLCVDCWLELVNFPKPRCPVCRSDLKCVMFNHRQQREVVNVLTHKHYLALSSKYMANCSVVQQNF